MQFHLCVRSTAPAQLFVCYQIPRMKRRPRQHRFLLPRSRAITCNPATASKSRIEWRMWDLNCGDACILLWPQAHSFLFLCGLSNHSGLILCDSSDNRGTRIFLAAYYIFSTKSSKSGVNILSGHLSQHAIPSKPPPLSTQCISATAIGRFGHFSLPMHGALLCHIMCRDISTSTSERGTNRCRRDRRPRQR